MGDNGVSVKYERGLPALEPTVTLALNPTTGKGRKTGRVERGGSKVVVLLRNATILIIPSPGKKSPRMSDYEDELDVGSEPPSIDPYEVLSVAKAATAEEIRRAYRKAALQHHPGEPSQVMPRV